MSFLRVDIKAQTGYHSVIESCSLRRRTPQLLRNSFQLKQLRTQKLPYIKGLGCQAIWISPIFQSPGCFWVIDSELAGAQRWSVCRRVFHGPFCRRVHGPFTPLKKKRACCPAMDFRIPSCGEPQGTRSEDGSVPTEGTGSHEPARSRPPLKPSP